MLRTRSLIGIGSNFIHCSCSVVGRVLIVDDADVDGQFDTVSVGDAVNGDEVGIFVERFLVGLEVERAVGLFVVGRRVGRGKTGLDVVGFDDGDNVG